MTVPTVLATTARRSCRLCSALESWPAKTPLVVVIGFPPPLWASAELPLPVPPGAAEGLVSLAASAILTESRSGSSSPLARCDPQWREIPELLALDFETDRGGGLATGMAQVAVHQAQHRVLGMAK